MAARLSDLVTDSQLEIEVFAEHTIQTTFNSNLAKGQRPTRVQEIWQRKRQLGKGSFGTVWLEKCTAGPSQGKLRAVKELKKGGNAESPNYYRELEAIAKFSQEKYRHHFVRSFGWYDNSNAIFITMEYLELGDLEGHLKARLSYMDARQITQQLLEGLIFMHNNNFAHRDLKPSNILVLNKGPGWWVKIADFGISKRIDGTALRTVIGTEAYLAPEVRGFSMADSTVDDEYTFSLAVDIWAVGAITFRMVTGRLAFSPQQLFNYVVRGSSFPLEESMSPEYAKFVVETMAASPRFRPTSQQALSYAWIQMQETPIPGSDSGSATSKILNTVNTNLPMMASAQWSTLNEDIPTLRLQNLDLSKNIINVSSLGNTVIREQKPYRLQQVQKLEAHRKCVASVAFSPDGRRLACSSNNIVGGLVCWELIVWEADKQGWLQQVQKLEGHGKWVGSVTFSPDGRRLASGAHILGSVVNGEVIVWEADKQGRLQQVQKLEGHRDMVTSVAFSPDGRRLASGAVGSIVSAVGEVIVWEADKQGRLQQVQRLESHRHSVNSVAFSPDGRRLASGGVSGEVIVWEADKQGRLQQVQKLEGHANTVTSVAFSPDGRRLVCGGGVIFNNAINGGGVVMVWEADKQGRLRQVQKLERHRDKVTSVAFFPDGRRLASGGTGGGGDGEVIVWEADKQGRLQQVQKLEGHRHRVTSVAFSPDGRQLASGGSETDGKVIIWEAEK